MNGSHEILTVGHSNHPLEHLIALIEKHGVTAVADVRSSPYSRLHPQFNREALHQELARRGIAYVYLGAELGARSKDPLCYEKGKVQYDRLARTDLFRQGIERLLKGMESYRVALLCAERDPLKCHRTLLVARSLDAHGVTVSHILANGALTAHSELMEDLMAHLGMLQQPELYRSRNEQMEYAYASQGRLIAFEDEEMLQPTERSASG